MGKTCRRGLLVISEGRPEGTGFDYPAKVTAQVTKLLYRDEEQDEDHAGLLAAAPHAGAALAAPENEEGFFASSRDSAMREKGALNEAARRPP